MGILQARILEWVAIPSSRGSSQPRVGKIEPESLMFPALAGRFFTTSSDWYILFFIFFSIMIYCRILDIFSCAISRQHIKKTAY